MRLTLMFILVQGLPGSGLSASNGRLLDAAQAISQNIATASVTGDAWAEFYVCCGHGQGGMGAHSTGTYVQGLSFHSAPSALVTLLARSCITLPCSLSTLATRIRLPPALQAHPVPPKPRVAGLCSFSHMGTLGTLPLQPSTPADIHNPAPLKCPPATHSGMGAVKKKRMGTMCAVHPGNTVAQAASVQRALWSRLRPPTELRNYLSGMRLGRGVHSLLRCTNPWLMAGLAAGTGGVLKVSLGA